MKKIITLVLTIAIALSMVTVAFAANFTADTHTTDTPATSAPATSAPVTSTPVTTLNVVENDNDVIENNEFVVDTANDAVENNEFVVDTTNDIVENNEIVADTTNDVATNIEENLVHEHEWKLLGHGELGFTVVCACGSQYSSPFEPCEHVLSVSVEELFPEFHAYECENCPYYARMSHIFDYCVNEDSHEWSCIDCGYVVSESEHTFENLGFNESTHTQTCIECGYITTVEHQFIAEIEGNFTIIHCDSCDYVSEKRCNHDNTYMIDELNHVALCKRCNEFVDEQHNFFDGVCECGYEAVETTQYGILTDFARAYDNKGDRIIRIEMLIDHEIYEFYCDYNVNYREWNEGSFVKIKLNGNEMSSIVILIDSNITEDEENFENYTSSSILNHYYPMEDITFEDLIIEDVKHFEDRLEVEFNRLHATFFYSYEVYDLRDGEMGRLCEGDAVLYFIDNDIVYFIVIW